MKNEGKEDEDNSMTPKWMLHIQLMYYIDAVSLKQCYLTVEELKMLCLIISLKFRFSFPYLDSERKMHFDEYKQWFLR